MVRARRQSSAVFFTACLAVQAIASSAAAADYDGEATRAFLAGAAAFKQGDYLAAAAEFERADRIAPHPKPRYNAAIAWLRAGNDLRAATTFDAVLRDPATDAGKRGEASEQLRALDRRVPPVDVVGPAGSVVLFEGSEQSPPVRLRAAAGEHRISLRYSSGRLAERVIRFEPSVTRTLDFLAGLDAPTRVVVVRTSAAPAPPLLRRKVWTPGFVAAGVALASGGLAVVLGTQALAARDDFEDSQRRDADARARAAAYRTWTNAAWVGAGAFAVASAVLFVVPPTRPVRIGVRAAGLLVEGRF